MPFILYLEAKISNGFQHVLAILFPPKIDGIRDWNRERGSVTLGREAVWVNAGPVNWLPPCDGSSDACIEEEGWCGTAKPKKYRDGIDRVKHEGI